MVNHHVNNNVIGQYFENARANLYAELAPNWPRGDEAFVIARTNITFRRELHRPAALRIGSAVQRIGETSITLGAALFRVVGDTLEGVAACESVSVLIDRATRKPLRIPDDVRALCAGYMLVNASA